MKPERSIVRVGDVLTRSQDAISPNPDSEYREITVKLWGKGVVQRGVVAGVAIAGSRRFVARTGQFILSRIDARNGAFGLVPNDLDGALVSNDFPIFSINESRMFPPYLGWLCRTTPFAELCRRASEGTTNRVRLDEGRFLQLQISLPPLVEQRRIVARIDEIAARIGDAKTLRHQVSDGIDAMRRAIITGDSSAKPTAIRDLVRLRHPDVTVRASEIYQFAGVYCFGRGVL